MKSCGCSIWQLLSRHGASVPRHPRPATTTTTTVSHFACSFETREAARRGNPSLLWPKALHLTLVPKWKNVHSTTRTLRRWNLRSAVHWKTRRGALNPPFLFWLSITLKLVEKSFTVCEGDWRLRNRGCVPVPSVLPHRHNTLPQRTNVHTNTFPPQSQIVSGDVTLKVQNRLQGSCSQRTSQFSIVNTPGEMFLLSFSFWYSLGNLHLTHNGKVDLLGSVQRHPSQEK